MINHSLNVDVAGVIVSDPAEASVTNGVKSYAFSFSFLFQTLEFLSEFSRMPTDARNLPMAGRQTSSYSIS